MNQPLIYEAFPLHCALCGAAIRIIAFVIEAPAVGPEPHYDLRTVTRMQSTIVDIKIIEA